MINIEQCRIAVASPDAIIIFDEKDKNTYTVKISPIINDVETIDNAIEELKSYDGAAIIKRLISYKNGKIIGKKGAVNYYYNHDDKKIYMLQFKGIKRRFTSIEHLKTSYLKISDLKKANQVP